MCLYSILAKNNWAIKSNQMVTNIIIRFKEMQVQDFKWKLECLVQWDQECKRANAELQGKRIKEDEQETFETSSSENQNEATHKIKQGQTLYGISLLYQVEPENIKRRNSLPTEQIYFLRELIIPNPKRQNHIHKEPSKQEKVSQVMKKLNFNANQIKLAQRILVQSSWNVEKTIEKYRTDVEWERSYAPIVRSMLNIGLKRQ